MKLEKFDEKFKRAWSRSGEVKALTLSPKLEKMPLPMQRFDEPFLPWSKAIIDATRDLLCAYIFDVAAYLSLGAAGAIAMERAIAYANGDGETITIWHGPIVGPYYGPAAAAFGVDAITLVSENSYEDADHASRYNQAGIEVFLLRESGSLSGSIVDDWLSTENGLHKILIVESWKVLYLTGGDDFADQARAALQAWQYSP